MSNRIKALGVVALAILAVAVPASSASGAVAKFSSEKYPATLTGTQTSPHVFLSGAGPLSCTVAKFTGELAEKSQFVSVTPTYETCSLAGKEATVAMEGCTHKLDAGGMIGENESMGGMQILCPAEKEIKVTSGECVIKIPPMAESLGFADFKNLEGGEFQEKLDVNLSYSVNNKCGPKEGTYNDGKTAGTYKVKGNNGPVGVAE